MGRAAMAGVVGVDGHGGTVGLAAVDDDRMLLAGLTAWCASAPDLRLAATTGTVDDLLRHGLAGIDVVLLDLLLGDRSDPRENVRRLVASGTRVLVISVVADPDQILAAYSHGAAGYLTKDHDLDTMAETVRAIAAGADPCPPELAFMMANDSRPARPCLSDQERRLLVRYASGMTLDTAARRIGVSPSTAKNYLERIKQKYRALGRPTYTELDLAERAREDGLRPPTYRDTARRSDVTSAAGRRPRRSR